MSQRINLIVDGKAAVKKFWVAHDCGQIINPGSMQNVIEGTSCKRSRAR